MFARFDFLACRQGVPCSLAMGFVLLAVLAAPAAGQSWLSEGFADASQGQDTVAPSTAGGRGELERMDLEQLVAAARQTPVPTGLYAALKARFEEAGVAAPDKDARAALERRVIPALLRVGENVAPAAAQERLARSFVERFPDDEQFPQVFFYLTSALFRQGKPLEESFFFDAPALATLPAPLRSRYLSMQAEAARRGGNAIKAAEYLLQESREGGENTDERRRAVLEVLEETADPAALAELLGRHASLAWLAGARPFLEARALINAGRLGEALLALERLERDPQASTPTQRKFLLQARAEVNARLRVRPERIGVLLPLGSTNAALRELALETLDGLRMAVQFTTPPRDSAGALDFDPAPPRERAGAAAQGPVKSGTFELVLRDSANNPKQAAEMVETLARDDHVVAIVGPLARAESEAAAARAEQVGVPLISLSLTLDLPPGGQYTFRNSRSQEDEVRDLVLYALDYLNNRRFAILYPDTPYGARMMELFWNEVTRNGGAVTAAAAYAPSGTRTEGRKPVGLKEIFESFTGLNRPLPEKTRLLLERVGDDRPDPVVDFDALYIPVGPDGAQDLRLIAPYPVTVDAERVQLLGNRFWNDDAVLVAGGFRLEGAVFSDVFDRSSVNPRVAEFHARHRALFGHRPRYQAPGYYTALGYDTVGLLMSLLQEPANRSPAALARALKARAAFTGVTGLTSFRPNGEAQRESIFIRIRGGEFTRIVQ